jgi:3-deoxy-D-manno-octulosonate 8-phosphate phosphatase (KDO 8-P phosphatase)
VHTRESPWSIPLQERCSAIELLVLDVDGVLTEGGIVHGSGRVELKQFHVRDGTGLKIWQQCGKRAAVITGRSSSVVDVRAAELGIDLVVQGARDKRRAYDELLARAGVAPAAVCCIGDDLPELPLLAISRLAVAVADACAEVRAKAHYITQRAGGQGAAREVIELVLRCQGLWPQGS